MDYSAVDRLIASGHTISTMESCTGGLLASVITDRSGASDIFPGGFVTYSNAAKILYGVPAEVIDNFGVYSPETAEAMARACAAAHGTDIGVGITGSLGRKDPANRDSIAGCVYYSVLFNGRIRNAELNIPDAIGSRSKMKQYVVGKVLEDIGKLIC